MSPTEAVARWEAFLARLRERWGQTLAEAEQGCAQLLDQSGLDPLPLSNAWTAIENQLRELGTRAEQTWTEKVEPALEAGGVDPDLLLAELEKQARWSRELEQQKLQVELRIFADAAARILAQAKLNLSRDHRCSQCGGPLKLSDRFFRSTQVPCSFCDSVNTYVPGAQVQAVEWFCCHHLARKSAEKAFFAWLDAAEALRSSSDEDEDGAHAEVERRAEEALRDWYRAYLRARIEIVPEYAKDFDRDLEGRMAEFYARIGKTPVKTRLA